MPLYAAGIKGIVNNVKNRRVEARLVKSGVSSTSGIGGALKAGASQR